MKWNSAPLDDVLVHNREYIDSPEHRQYPKLSVKLYGRGVVLDAPADGATLKMKRHQLAKAGQVILSEIWGKKGAIGFVPPEGSGALCTSHFFLFDVRTERVEPKWLRMLFDANYLQKQLDAEAKGTTGYASVRPSVLLKCEVPLPPIEEQRRLVAKVEGLQTKIREARRLRQQSDEATEALCRSLLADDSGAELRPLRELVRLRPADIAVRPDETYRFAGVYCFGRGVFAGAERTGLDFAYRKLTRLNTGNFVYPKLMAWEGAFGVVPPECSGLVVSTEFPVFEVFEDRVLPEVLDTYFRTPAVWPIISGVSTGTNVRRRRLNPQDFLDHRMPVPTPETQKRLRAVRQRVNSLRNLQEQTARELDALMPSIREKAFCGAL